MVFMKYINDNKNIKENVNYNVNDDNSKHSEDFIYDKIRNGDIVGGNNDDNHTNSLMTTVSRNNTSHSFVYTRTHTHTFTFSVTHTHSFTLVFTHLY